nr:MAG TPA: antitoxin [Caudoviricetes sp.]
MLVALKAVPRALCGVCGEWLRVYYALRLFRGSVRGFRVKDDRLYP